MAQNGELTSAYEVSYVGAPLPVLVPSEVYVVKGTIPNTTLTAESLVFTIESEAEKYANSLQAEGFETTFEPMFLAHFHDTNPPLEYQ